MNKRQLAAELAKRTDLKCTESLEVIDHLISLIKETLAEGDDVRLAGLGRFHLKYTPGGIRRDPFRKCEEYESPDWYEVICSIYETTDLYINGRLLDLDKGTPIKLDPAAYI